MAQLEGLNTIRLQSIQKKTAASAKAFRQSALPVLKSITESMGRELLEPPDQNALVCIDGLLNLLDTTSREVLLLQNGESGGEQKFESLKSKLKKVIDRPMEAQEKLSAAQTLLSFMLERPVNEHDESLEITLQDDATNPSLALGMGFRPPIQYPEGSMFNKTPATPEKEEENLQKTTSVTKMIAQSLNPALQNEYREIHSLVGDILHQEWDQFLIKSFYEDIVLPFAMYFTENSYPEDELFHNYPLMRHIAERLLHLYREIMEQTPLQSSDLVFTYLRRQITNNFQNMTDYCRKTGDPNFSIYGRIPTEIIGCIIHYINREVRGGRLFITKTKSKKLNKRFTKRRVKKGLKILRKTKKRLNKRKRFSKRRKH